MTITTPRTTPSFVSTLLSLVLLLTLTWSPVRAQAFTEVDGDDTAWSGYENDGDLTLVGVMQQRSFASNYLTRGNANQPTLRSIPANARVRAMAPPVVDNPIADTVYIVNSLDIDIDLEEDPIVFSDPDGDLLTYTVTSSDAAVATAAINGAILTIDPVSAGSTTITVTADDGTGNQVSDAFVVRIFGVTATEGTFEDRVEIRWGGVTEEDLYFRIERDGTVLTVVGNQGNQYTDTTGEPRSFDNFNNYCVHVVDGTVDLYYYCVPGYRTYKSPTSFTASNGTSETQVNLTWRDNSTVEDGYVLGRSSKVGLQFDGTTNHAVTADSVDLSGSFTLTFRAQRQTTGTETVLSHGINASDEGFEIGFNSSNEFQLFVPGGPLTTTTTYTDTDWHHYAVTYDATTRRRALYVDGVLEASDVASNAYTGVGPLVMGRTAWSASNFFDDILDEVQFWTTARSAAAIAKGQTQLLTGQEPGLAGYWPIDTDTGTMALDVKGSNHAVFVDMDETAWSSAGSDTDHLRVLPTDTPSFADRMVVPGVTHSYYLYLFEDVNGNGTFEEGVDYTSNPRPFTNGWRGFVLPPAQVLASDGQYTDRVRITWTDQSENEDQYAVYRYLGADTTGVTPSDLGSVPSDSTLFDDLTASAMTLYTYCVAATTGGMESVQVCDAGTAGGLAPPENLVASTNTFDDRVQLTWDDRAATSDGFIIKREGTPIDTTRANVEIYNDFSALQDTPYTYCVQAYSMVDPDNPSLSAEVCAMGTRANVLAPAAVAASDDAFEDQVAVTWQNPATTAMLFNVYRVDPQTLDTMLLNTALNSATSYSYLRAPSDVSQSYCVAAVTVPGAPTSMVAQIERLYAEHALQADIRRTVGEADAPFAESTVDAGQFMARVESIVAAGFTTGQQRSQASMAVVESARVCDTGSRSINPPEDVTATYDEFETHVEVSWTDNSTVDQGLNIYRNLPALGSAALDFDGVDGRVDVPDDDALDLNTFTVEVWVYPREAKPNFQPLVAKEASNGTSRNYGLFITQNALTVAFAVQNATCSGNISYTSNGALTEDAWNHVAMTYDGSALSLYLNGVLDKSEPLTGGLCQNNQTLKIGSVPVFTPFNGQLDEVRIWNVARTQAEIEENRIRSLRGTEPGLVGYWPMEEGSGTVTDDVAGSQDGTLVGGVTWSAPGDLLGQVGPLRTSYSDYTGAPGVAYTYSITAYDTYGESQPGSDLGFRKLKPVAAFQASDGTFETKVVLTWLDESRGEDHYVIHRDGVLLDSTEANVSTYTDTAVTTGTAYAYSIAAVDAYGSSIAVADSGSTMILPPADFNASDTYTNQIVLAWTDASSLETGYEIRRDSVVIHTTAANVTTYTDATAIAGQTYTYCVATKGAGTVLSAKVYNKGIRPVISATTGFTPEVAFTSGNASAMDEFGASVAVDGNWAVTGAPGALGGFGTAFFYELEGADWRENTFYSHGTPQSGTSVAISGTYALVGAPFGDDVELGFVYPYELVGGSWERIEPAFASFVERFGESVSMDGKWALVGAPGYDLGAVLDVGRIEFYKQDRNGSWDGDGDGEVDPPQIIVSPLGLANLQFGKSVSLNGNYAIVGGPGAGTGAAWVYQRQSDSWTEINQLEPTGLSGSNLEMGASVAMGDGWAVAGVPGNDDCGSNCGAIQIFKLVDNAGTLEWALASTQRGTTSGEALGRSVAISGNTVIAGTAQNTARTFVYTNGAWTEGKPATYTGTGGFAGQASALAMSDSWVIFGAPTATNANNETTGAVYMSALLTSPEDVQASDGSFDDRIQVTWTDQSKGEAGFQIYRREADGQLALIGETSANTERFDDLNVVAGGSFEYCVRAFLGTRVSGLNDQTCDLGWRPANGTISGRVAALGGGGTKDVELCLSPSPNRGLILDGEGGQVRIDDMTFPNDLDAFTFSFWMKSNDDTDNGTPFSYATTDEEDNQILLFDYSNFQVFISGDANPPTGLSANDGQWHHIAVTWRSSDGQVQIYKDGKIEITQTLAMGETIPAGGVLILGQEQDALGGGFDPNQAFLGELDEVRLWSSVRDASTIQADMMQQLRGDEENLIGYWPFDEGTRRVTANLTGTGNNGLLVDGAYWTEMGAFDTCDTTDLEGNYALAGLRYGDTTEFLLTASAANRTFEPSFKTITLSTDSPVQNEVQFTDNTSFTVAGVVHYAYEGQPTACPVPDVQITIDGTLKGTTEADGTFFVSVDPSAEGSPPQRITPALGDGADTHTFSPPEAAFFVEDNISGVDFLSLKTRRLDGTYSGSCNTDIGAAKLRIFTEDGCFDQVFDVEGDFAFDLPPQRYLVEVIPDPRSSPLAADIIEFFDNLGAVEVDLTEVDSTRNFIYRAPLSITFNGFVDADQSMCMDDTFQVLRDGELLREIPHVPLLEQPGTRVDPIVLDITVVENYGNGQTCPLEGATITVFDQINDQDAGFELTTNAGGVAVYLDDQPMLPDGSAGPLAGDKYQTYANTPNVFGGQVIDGVDRSFQKSLTAIVDIPGRDAVTEAAWVVVTGRRTRIGTFTTLPTVNVPMHILRDPPGDGSFSFIEKGETLCRELEINGEISIGLSQKVKLATGLRFDAGFFGLTFPSEVEFEASQKLEVSGKVLTENSFGWCVTLGETISTSSSSTFVGESADVYVGTGVNFLFAPSDILEEVEDEACQLALDEAISIDLDGFDTFYTYSQNHVANTLLPQLERLSEAAEDPEPFDEARTNWQTILNYNAIQKGVAFGDCDRIQDTIAQDQCEILADNRGVDLETAREALLDEQRALCQENFQDPKDRATCETEASRAIARVGLPELVNRSFDAGAEYAYTHSAENSRTNLGGIEFELKTTAALDIKAEVAGNGPASEVELSFGLGAKVTASESQSNGTTVGYVLSDDDIGDFFSVDVVDDFDFTTPVFQLRSGTSSNPWEPGWPSGCANIGDTVDGVACETLALTQPRDQAMLSINPPEQHNVQPDEPGVFTLTLTNGSQSQEGREYILRTIHATNPGGAVLSAQGAPIHSGLSFFLSGDPATASQEVALTVKRGPTRFSYEDIEVQLYPPGEYDIWGDGGALQLADTVRFSVYYEAPCTDISILRPKVPWTYNSTDAADGPLFLIANDLTLNSIDLSVQALGLYYRRAGTTDYAPVPNGTLTFRPFSKSWPANEQALYPNGRFENGDGSIIIGPNATSYGVEWTPPNDGGYELRAQTECGNRSLSETVFSDIAPGTVDTTPPVAFGTPEPSDAVLAFGQDVSITFNEPVACGSLINDGPDQNVWLYDAADASQAVEAVCDGRTLIIKPTLGWDALENQQMRVELIGEGDASGTDPLTDLLGNPLQREGAQPANVQWSFTVQRSAVAWNPNQLVATVSRYSSTALTAALGNGRAQEATFELTSVPAFLTPSVALNTEQTIAASAAFTVGFTVDTSGEPGMLTGAVSANVTVDGETLEVVLPVAIDLIEAMEQVVALNQGWTWFSLNREPAEASPTTVFNTVDAGPGDVLKSQTAFSLYDSGAGWVGALASVGPGSAYQVKLAQASTLVVGGTQARADSALTILTGWNWLGYLPEVPLGIATAMGSSADSYTPSDGDVLKSQMGFETYSSGAWVPGTMVLTPGQGYMLFSQSDAQFQYPGATTSTVSIEPTVLAVQAATAAQARATQATAASASVRSALAAEERGAESGPKVIAEAPEDAEPEDAEAPAFMPAAYAHSMTLIGNVTLDDEVLADEATRVWLTDETGTIRGSASLQYVEALGDHRLFLMLYSDAEIGEAFEVHVHDSATEQTVTLGKRLHFKADYRAGTVSEPVLIAAETEGYKAAKAAAELPTEYALAQNYPNPFNPTTTIHYELPEASQVSLVVYDVLGREVLRLVDTEQAAGRYDVALDASRLASGVYLYRIEAGTFKHTRQMVLMK